MYGLITHIYILTLLKVDFFITKFCSVRVSQLSSQNNRNYTTNYKACVGTKASICCRVRDATVETPNNPRLLAKSTGLIQLLHSDVNKAAPAVPESQLADAVARL